MKTQIAKTTKEALVSLIFHGDKVMVPVGTEVTKTFGGVGHVYCWYVTDFFFITDPLTRVQAERYGIPVTDDHVEFPE